MQNSYDKKVGYSPLENVDQEKMLQVIRVNRKIIDTYYPAKPAELVLVAGAGQGYEALLIHREYGMVTVGVDLNIENIRISERQDPVFFQKQNISQLAFLEEVFSLIYSYHVLEHVNDHIAVLQELNRVLKPGGVLFIGFPNKHRLFSYIGTSQKVTVTDKLKWNLNDYRFRLKGKFENKFGAHAGFTEKEFLSIATQMFGVVHSVRDQYMLYKYPKHTNLIRLLIRTKLNEFLFPSNYYICIKSVN
jgi:2-polyprenyl-3-methyl-5-hydroxy-6-metoxy-1,4-benzoquinol methylase